MNRSPASARQTEWRGPELAEDEEESVNIKTGKRPAALAISGVALFGSEGTAIASHSHNLDTLGTTVVDVAAARPASQAVPPATGSTTMSTSVQRPAADIWVMATVRFGSQD